MIRSFLNINNPQPMSTRNNFVDYEIIGWAGRVANCSVSAWLMDSAWWFRNHSTCSTRAKTGGDSVGNFLMAIDRTCSYYNLLFLIWSKVYPGFLGRTIESSKHCYDQIGHFLLLHSKYCLCSGEDYNQPFNYLLYLLCHIQSEVMVDRVVL